MNAFFDIKKTAVELRFTLHKCPILAAAEKTGWRFENELVHHTLYAGLKQFVKTIDPRLQIQLPEGPQAQPVIRVIT
jgi:hypothetical protein